MKNKLIILSLFLLSSCDFTSVVNKEILHAQELADNKQYEEAAAVYEKVLNSTVKPNVKTRIYFHLSELYTSFIPNIDKAIENYKKVLEIDVEPIWHVKSMEKIASIYYEFKKDYPQAIFYYKKLIQYYPPLENYDEYVVKILSALTELKNIDEFEKFVKDNKLSKNAKVAVKLDWYYGLIYFYNQQWMNAINRWKNYLKYEKDADSIVRAKFFLANSYEMVEMLREAYNVYYSILNEYPNKEVIQSRLESLYARRAARKR